MAKVLFGYRIVGRAPSAFQVSSITNDFAGANNYRPNVVCDPYATSQTINSCLKRIALSSKLAAELRVETFNLFNRVNYGPPQGNRSLPSFGTITTTFEARQVQLGAKLLW